MLPTETATITPEIPVPVVQPRSTEVLPLEATVVPSNLQPSVITPMPPRELPISGQVVVMLVLGTVLSASAAIFLIGLFARRSKARDDEFNLN